MDIIFEWLVGVIKFNMQKGCEGLMYEESVFQEKDKSVFLSLSSSEVKSILWIILNFSIFFALGVALDEVKFVIAYVFGFIIMRNIIPGYHAKSRIECFGLSIFLEMINVFIFKCIEFYIPVGKEWESVCGGILALISVLILAKIRNCKVK